MPTLVQEEFFRKERKMHWKEEVVVLFDYAGKNGKLFTFY